MISRRLLVTGGVLLGIAIVLAVIGFFVGIPIVQWKAGMALGAKFVMSSPRELVGISIATAMLFAWLPLQALVAAIVFRWRQRADVSVRALAIYVAIPFVLVVGYTVLRAFQLGDYASVTSGSIQPMISITSLAPGGDEARILGFASVCLWIFIGTRKPPKL